MKKKKNVPHGAWSNAGFSAGSPGQTRGMTRGTFLRGAGVAAAGAGAAAVGLGGVASAVPLPHEENPDPVHIVKAGQPMGGIPATNLDNKIWVYPVGDPTPSTLLQAGREQDPNLSITDWDNSTKPSNPEDPTTGGPYVPLSETDSSSEWDPRLRTLDAMNIEWTANNVQKKPDESPGEVILKNTGVPFEFAQWSSEATIPGTGIIVYNDCVVRGEENSYGKTKINNGAGILLVNVFFGYYFNEYPVVQCWHKFASMVTVKNLVIDSPIYPGFVFYDGLDLTDWTVYPLYHAESDDVEMLNFGGNPHPTAEGVLIPFLFETGNYVRVNECYASVVGVGAVGAGCFLAQGYGPETPGPVFFEITGNTFDLSAFSLYFPNPDFINAGISLIVGGFGSGLVQGNTITTNEGLGILSIFSHNTQYLNNKFYGTGTGIALVDWSGEFGGNTIQNADFINMNLNPWDVCVFIAPNAQNTEVYEHAQLGVKYFPPGTTLCNQVIDAPGYDPDPPEGTGCGVALVDDKPGFFITDLVFVDAVGDFVELPGYYEEVTPGEGEYGFFPPIGLFIPAEGIPEWGIPPVYGTHNWVTDCTAYPKNTYIHQWDKLCSGTHPAYDKLAAVQAKLAGMKAAAENFLGRKITH